MVQSVTERKSVFIQGSFYNASIIRKIERRDQSQFLLHIKKKNGRSGNIKNVLK